MQRPTALGLTLCDQVILDTYTGKRTLVGMFDELFCDGVPFIPPPLWVYAALTDGQGRIALDLVVSDMETEEELVVVQHEMEFTSPLSITHLRMNFPDLQFPRSGYFLFQLSAEGFPVCHRRLHIVPNEE